MDDYVRYILFEGTVRKIIIMSVYKIEKLKEDLNVHMMLNILLNI